MLGYTEFTKEILNEMPKRIGNWSPQELLDHNNNKEIYLELKRDKFKELVFKVDEYSNMFRAKGIYFILDDKIQQVTYKMTFKTDRNKLLGNYVWQSTVWSQGGISYLKGLPTKMIFDYLLKKYEVVVTDSEQSFDGERFWRNIIQEAFTKNINVYYYNFLSKELIKMKDFYDWWNFQTHNDVWGDNKQHELKRMLITTKEL
jgi:hypothetical protein